MGVGWHVHVDAVRQAITCTLVNEFWASYRKCAEMTVLCAPYVRGSCDLAFSMADKEEYEDAVQHGWPDHPFTLCPIIRVLPVMTVTLTE